MHCNYQIASELSDLQVVLAMVPVLDPAGFVGLRGNGITPSKSMILHANHHIKATNIDQRVQCLVCKICSSAWRIFWLSPIFDNFKSEQAAAQNPRFWAENGNNFRAAC